MAWLLTPDDKVTVVHPKDGKEFSLEEIQAYVEGDFEERRTFTGKLMLINEDGRRLKLPLNRRASALYGHDTIVGNALILEKGEIS